MATNSAYNQKYLPFKYKLTLVINAIILALLAGLFFVLQRYIEQNATAGIKADLKDTKTMVSRLLEDRQSRLGEIAKGISGAELIRTILTDQTLDQATRDDIVQNEVLPDYPQLSLLGVVDPDGGILALNQAGQSFRALFPEQAFFKASLRGESGSGFLIQGERCVQMMAQPITIGEGQQDPILIGMVLVGIPLSQEDLDRIKELSHAELVFFHDQAIFLATAIRLMDQKPLPRDALESFLRQSAKASGAEPVILALANERFLALTVSDPIGNVPPYVVAKSLDQQLTFVKQIRSTMIQFGTVGILAGILVSFFFALGISRPIKRLQEAALAVDRGNLNYAVRIESRDEFAQLGSSFNQMIQGLNEKERIRGIMNKVVSKEIADEILQGDLQLGGELKTATILFSDIRGFTTFSETLNPRTLLDLLNRYFTNVSVCIDTHRGNIDKYIGDAIMALFGLPITHPDHARNAILAALDMIEVLKQFNQALEREIGKTIHIGIGMNTGTVVAGLMGAATRMEYTVLGDEVNLASRLEGLTKQYGVQILISEATYFALQAIQSPTDLSIQVRELDVVQVKGKTKGVTIYQVLTRDEIAAGLDIGTTRFQQARQLLETRQFQASREAFQALAADFPQDPVPTVFLQRAESYVREPNLYEDHYQNGVYISTKK